MDFGDEVIARMDAQTLQTTIYPTPAPRSRPRRTMLDDNFGRRTPENIEDYHRTKNAVSIDGLPAL